MQSEARLARVTMRRMALVTVVTGIAALGGLTTAPLAQAAQADATQLTVIDGVGNGPDAFMVGGNGRTPIFYCDPAKPNQRHNNCVLVVDQRF
jgi:hypothetical protein